MSDAAMPSAGETLAPATTTPAEIPHREGPFTQQQLETIRGWMEADGIPLPAEGAGDSAQALPEPEAAGPHEYDFRLGPAGFELDADTAQADRGIRQMLSSAGFDRATGSALAQEAVKLAARFENASEGERELFRREQSLLLRKTWGDSYAEKMSATRALVRRLDTQYGGKVSALLEATGAADSALAIELISRIALRSK
ncbi:MAG TPA: hypothetical protein PKC23_06190 [Candidatus Desulfobacillus sp.]|nr:hypothetical protein [Candidatus Desulfobacillus sp.]